jgi:hypothetical protein
MLSDTSCCKGTVLSVREVPGSNLDPGTVIVTVFVCDSSAPAGKW